jgi:hypothetical protein
MTFATSFLLELQLSRATTRKVNVGQTVHRDSTGSVLDPVLPQSNTSLGIAANAYNRCSAVTL